MHSVENKSKSGKKIYRSTLLRESYREDGKVRKRTIANLSNCTPQEISATKLALNHKDDLGALGSLSESVNLEVRPVHVRSKGSTQVHVFVVMLAYMIIRRLRKAWESFDLTVKDGIGQLATVCSMEVKIKGQDVCCVKIPQPREQSRQLLEALRIKLPEALPRRNIRVVTRKKPDKTKKIPIILRYHG